MTDKNLSARFEIREVRPEETEEAAGLEGICFPANEACAPAQMRARAVAAPELFLVAADRAGWQAPLTDWRRKKQPFGMLFLKMRACTGRRAKIL